MSSSSTSTRQPSEARLTLKPARIELQSAKVQMLLAGFATFAVCIFSFVPSLHVGFLLDDFLHIDYIYRALHSSPSDFLHNFYGNWANSPVMLSYRPLVSVSLFIDYLIWGANAFGFHLTNLILYWGCSLLVGLIALELTGMRGNRLGAAAPFWAALLFCAYPLHLESAAWIIGRVDLLCTLFTLISVWGYFRFRLLREKYLFHLSLASFIVAILCKEPAVVLPAVISVAEILLAPYWPDNNTSEFRPRAQTRRLSGVLSYWVIVGMYFPIRWAILGTMVGGYGGSPLAALKHLFDKGTVERIFFPENLDLIRRFGFWDLHQKLDAVLRYAYIGIAGLGLVRLVTSTASWRILLFLLSWLFLSIVPALQIWQISPNLVGSRLFFMASAPFTILLAFLALPAIDIIKKQTAKIVSIAGAVLLFVVLSVWSFCLQFDQQSWVIAANSIRKFVDDVKYNLKQIDPAKSILLLNLPTDCSGAGMLSRGDYLHFLFQRPFEKEPLSARLEVLEAPGGEPDLDLNYCASLRLFLDKAKYGRILQWQDSDGTSLCGQVSEWKPASMPVIGALPTVTVAANDLYFYSLANPSEISDLAKFENKFALVNPSSSTEWTVEQEGGRSFEKLSDGALRIRPGDKDLFLLFRSKQALSPLELDRALLGLHANNRIPVCVAFFWINKNAGHEQINFIDGINCAADSPYELKLGSNKLWALSPEIIAFGLKLPKGDYEIDFRGIELCK